jgi:protein phosphatase
MSAEDPQRSTLEYPPLGAVKSTQIPRPPQVQVALGAVTHRGKVRPNNEDNYLVAKLTKSLQVCMTSLPQRQEEARSSPEEGCLMMVADGMGGAVAGETASALAIEKIEEFVLHALHCLRDRGRKEVELAQELCQALERADRKVMERARHDFNLAGMGTTLTVAYSVGTSLYIVHVGDSRAYLLREGKLRQLTRDHTWVQEQVDKGLISPQDAKRSRFRNVITNVVGGPRQGVTPEIVKEQIINGDVLMLCSDGLYEPLPDEDTAITRVLREVGRTDPQRAAETLCDLALEHGAPDNVTVVTARYEVNHLPESYRSTLF